MPVLDRQPAAEHPAPGPSTRPAVPRSIPEAAPTPLQRHYINLSAIALVAGAVAITALETGSRLSSPLVKVCVAVAVPILLLTTGDAALRIWRSAWAWMAIDRGRGLFRLSWVAVAVLGMLVFVLAALVVLSA